MKNKIFRFLKNNWLFILFIIPFIFVCYGNKNPDNDIWFLLTSGRYVLQFGIPSIDPFTIHEGLSLIMQQWLSATILWQLYDWFGQIGLLFLFFLLFFCLSFMVYQLYYKTSNNKFLSILFSAIAMLLISEFIVMRPQIFTYCLLLLELYFLESYVYSSNKKYLWCLPILSLLLINLHASMWYFQFVFFLPFFINSFKIKKFTIQSYDIKPILKIMLLMVVIAFINPYGYKAFTFLFKSYGIDLINSYVREMKTIPFDLYGKSVLVLLLLVILSMNFFKKLKLDIRHICFLCGTTILTYMHFKCYPYFIFMAFYCLAYLFKDFSFKKIIKNIKFLKNIYVNKWVRTLFNGFLVGSFIMLFLTLFYTGYHSIKYFSFHSGGIEKAVLYIKDNYDVDKVRLFIDYNNGGYAEFEGIKSYADPRAELFFKRLNGKEDIFEEFVKITSNTTFEIEEFVDKYHFTHMIVFYNYYYLDEYMKTRDDYEVVYKEYIEGYEGDYPYLKIYALKELED